MVRRKKERPGRRREEDASHAHHVSLERDAVAQRRELGGKKSLEKIQKVRRGGREPNSPKTVSPKGNARLTAEELGCAMSWPGGG